MGQQEMLSDNEWELMKILWKNKPLPAAELAAQIAKAALPTRLFNASSTGLSRPWWRTLPVNIACPPKIATHC